jgi:soluble lytic murein transglycosylase-like protein
VETVPGVRVLTAVPRDPGAGEGDAAKAALVRRIYAVAHNLGVEPRLAEAVARAESNLDQDARSPDGLSVGAFQMKVPTRAEMQRRFAREGIGVSLADEVTLGVGYLDYLDRVFARRAVLDDAGRTTTAVPNDAERRRFAIAAYNAGEGRVAAAQDAAGAAGGDPRRFDHVRPFLPPITQRYVERVLAFAANDSAAIPGR